MAIQLDNEKGFLLIKTSRSEIMGLNPLNLGVCDSCNIKPTEGVFIAVLNRWYCPQCYERWYLSAEHFAEDFKFEKSKFMPIYNALIIQCN